LLGSRQGRKELILAVEKKQSLSGKGYSEKRARILLIGQFLLFAPMNHLFPNLQLAWGCESHGFQG
jgi:hypothetical protein